MSVNNESKPSATHPLPHTMLLLAGTFRSTLNGGGGGLEFYRNNRFARSSSVFNNFLNTFVLDCSSKHNEKPVGLVFIFYRDGYLTVVVHNFLDLVHIVHFIDFDLYRLQRFPREPPTRRQPPTARRGRPSPLPETYERCTNKYKPNRNVERCQSLVAGHS